MKNLIVVVTLLGGALGATAQSAHPVDADLPGLTTPLVVAKQKSEVGLQVTGFGGSDKLLRTGVSYRYGVAQNWETELTGTFARHSTFASPSIEFGGSAGDIMLKYRILGPFDYSVQAGLGYSDTPAQEHRMEAIAGASAGWSVSNSVRVYLNPRLVTLEDNTLVAFGLGAVVNVTQGIALFGDWIPLLSGDNALSTIDGSSEKVQLYAIGIRLTKLSPGLDLDLAFTNIVGQSSGFSLTPSLGNTGGGLVALRYRF